MNYFNLASGVLAGVLSFGLISCSSDKNKTADVYRAIAPTVIKAGQPVALKDFSESDQREFDVQDILSFQESRAAKVEINTTCKNDDREFRVSYQQPGSNDLKIHQVLPPEILLTDLDAAKVECGFEVTLRNSVGSRHIFPIATAKMRDSQKPEVEMEGGNSPLTYRVAKRDEVKVRFNNPTSAQAEIHCRDVRVGPLPFNKVMEISDFDFSISSDALNLQPVQTCRLIVSGNHFRETSALFKVIWPVPAPAVVTQEPFAAPPEQEVSPKTLENSFAFLTGRLPVEAGLVTLKNDLPFARYFRIQGPQLAARFFAYYSPLGLPPIYVPKNSALKMSIKSQQGAEIKQLSDGWEVKLSPSAQVTWLLSNVDRRQSYARFPCEGVASYNQWKISPLIIETLAENGWVADRTEVQLKDWFIIISRDARFNPNAEVKTDCSSLKRK